MELLSWQGVAALLGSIVALAAFVLQAIKEHNAGNEVEDSDYNESDLLKKDIKDLQKEDKDLFSKINKINNRVNDIENVLLNIQSKIEELKNENRKLELMEQKIEELHTRLQEIKKDLRRQDARDAKTLDKLEERLEKLTDFMIDIMRITK